MTTASETRAAAKSKLDRLLTADPHQKVDGSDWTPPEAMENQAMTGMRPLSRSKYKKGGRVQGETAAVHAGRKPRAKGGGVVDDLVNVDMKKANELRDGVKHDGGFAKGGAAHGADCRCAKCHGGRAGKASGGSTKNPCASSDQSSMRRYARGLAAQEKADLASPEHKVGVDQSWDEVNKMRAARGDPPLSRKATGGALTGGTRPTGGRMPRKSGGRAKKGTTVNVIIASGSKPAMPPPGAMPPPPGGPVGLHQAPPPVAAPAPMGPPASGAPPPMMRKRGGRTGYPIESGAGGALGRLEKVKAYG